MLKLTDWERELRNNSLCQELYGLKNVNEKEGST